MFWVIQEGDPWLRNHGIGIIIDKIDKYAQVLTSPPPARNLHKGGTNAGQYGLQQDLDLEKIADIPGFATHIVTTGRYGTYISANIGDSIVHSQEIYGGGSNVVMNLVMLYGEESLFGGRVSLAAGRMDQLSDFAASNLFCNFMNNSIYPGTEWAFRARGRPTKVLYVQAGIYFDKKHFSFQGKFCQPFMKMLQWFEHCWSDFSG